MTGFQTGSGRQHIFCLFCEIITNIILFCYDFGHTYMWATTTIHFARNDSYGKSWHFCDDHVCPDPVWRLSREGLEPGAGPLPMSRVACSVNSAEPPSPSPGPSSLSRSPKGGPKRGIQPYNRLSFMLKPHTPVSCFPAPHFRIPLWGTVMVDILASKAKTLC